MTKQTQVLLLFMLTVGLSAGWAADKLSASGITEPILDVKLTTSVAGIVSAKHFKEGDAVKEGDVILELDKRLEELEVARRKAILENRKVDFEATQTLARNSKAISKEELDKRELEYKVAAAECDIAIEQLRKRHLVSPLNGTIIEFHVEVGEASQPYTQTYQTLVRVADTRRGYFVSNLEAKAAAKLKRGQVVQLDLDTGAAPVSIQGKVDFLSPVADPASGLIRVKVLFENADGKVRPGLGGQMFFE